MMTYDLPRIVSVQKENDKNAYITLEFDAYREFIMKIMFDDEIDEEHYLRENPDVEQAVKDGQVPSGNYHFKGMGYVEGRKFRSNRLPAETPAPARAAETPAPPRPATPPAPTPLRPTPSFPRRV